MHAITDIDKKLMEKMALIAPNISSYLQCLLKSLDTYDFQKFVELNQWYVCNANSLPVQDSAMRFFKMLTQTL